jgi:GTP-binding protein
MIPVVALIGRHNVGKSTLFNRLTKSQNALVADFPGLTRDRQYGDVYFDKKPFIVVDTGGIGVDDAAVDELMSKQTATALEEADLVLFMVDGRSGITGLDETIAQSLRKISKPVFLVVNKTEGLDEDIASSEFQSLGLDLNQIQSISAAHGQGIQSLLKKITANFPKETEASILETALNTDKQNIRITFVGRPNVGKSTLVNRILGEERVVVYDLPGTTRDSIEIPFARNEQDYTLVDTAGIRRRSRIDEKIEKFSVIKTLQSIKESHVCLMLIDAKEGLTDQDMHLLAYIIEAGKGLVIAVNKWDGLEEDHKEQVKSEILRRLQFVKFAKIRYISALYGSGVGGLFKDINEAYDSAMQRFSTPQLTRMLQQITTTHTPPLVHGRRIKLRYAHAGGHNPPLIVIHGNQVNNLPESYKRYLINAFMTELGIIGTPLQIEFKGSDNPFKGKKNQLTERQIKRKKRLMKYVKGKKH